MKANLTFLIKGIFTVAILVLSQSSAISQDAMVFEDWVTNGGTQDFFIHSTVVTDQYDATYVAGATLNGSGDYDILISKYNPSGVLVWSDTYDGSGNGDDAALAIYVDQNCNLYLTGTTYSSGSDTLDVITMHYDSSGTLQWTDVYSGSDGLADIGTSISADQNNLYIGGIETSATDLEDFLILKYSFAGSLVWSNSYDENGMSDICSGIKVGNKAVTLVGGAQSGVTDWDYLSVNFGRTTGTLGTHATASGGSAGFDRVTAIEKDADDNIYITGTAANGTSGYDIFTVKLDTNLNVVWDVTYNSGGAFADVGNAIALDGSGNVYVAGYSGTATNGSDFTTIKYNSSGAQQWVKNWNGIANGSDTLKAIIVDPSSGDIIVSGTTWNGASFDFETIKYNSSGTELWAIPFNDKYGYHDHVSGLAGSASGGVVVAGQSVDPDGGLTYVTVQYSETAFVQPVDTDSVSTSLRFLTNHDQLVDTDGNSVDRVKYYSKHCYPNIYLMEDTLSYVFYHIDDDTTTTDTMQRVNMSFGNSIDGKKLRPLGKMPYFNNYYLGHIAEGRPFVPLHKQVYLENVWTNVDVEYSTNQRGLKYYIIVKPGAEAGSAILKYEGQNGLSVNGNDELVIETDIGDLVQPQAIAYKMDTLGNLTPYGWQPEYSVSTDQVTFEAIGTYDIDEALVIEVNWGSTSAGTSGFSLDWATFYGGGGMEFSNDIEIDASENIYVGGTTNGPNFPVSIGNVNANPSRDDFFMIKFNPNRSLMWATTFGNNDFERFGGMAYTPSGNAIIVGSTSSSNMYTIKPLTSSYLDNALNSISIQGEQPADAFIIEFNGINGVIDWASYYGGSGGGEEFSDLVVTSTNEIIVCGSSPSNGGLTNADFFTRNPGGSSFFSNVGTGTIVKFNSSREVDWSTKVGSANLIFSESGFNSIALNSSGQIFVAGYTDGNDFSTFDPGGVYFDASYNGGASDLYLMRFESNMAISWATYFGGSDQELFPILAVGPTDDLYLTCQSGSSISTPSSDMPFANSPGGYQNTTIAGATDFYLSRFTSGLQFEWASYYGGSSLDIPKDIDVDWQNNLFFVGLTLSSDLPTLAAGNGYDQSTFGGSSNNGVIMNFNSSMQLGWATYFGQTNSGGTTLRGVATRNNRLLVTGEADILPTQDPGMGAYFDNSHAGLGDILVVEFSFPVGIINPVATQRTPDLLFWPNPASEHFWIDFSTQNQKKGPFSIAMYDISGKLVLNSSTNFLPTRINRQNLALGVYIITLSGKDGFRSYGKIVLK
jgi:hypothetical protein